MSDDNTNECLAQHLVAFIDSAAPDLVDAPHDPETGEPIPLPPALTALEIRGLRDEIDQAICSRDVKKLAKIARHTRDYIGKLAAAMPGE